MPPRHRKPSSEGATPFFSVAFLFLVICWPTLWDTASGWGRQAYNQVTCDAERMMRDCIWHAYHGGF